MIRGISIKVMYQIANLMKGERYPYVAPRTRVRIPLAAPGA